MSGQVYDVIQVGYGPVSKVLAMMLARQGWSVGIFERWPAPYVLPRAVCVDHELYRVLHASGFREEIAAVAQPAPVYRWFNSAWQELLAIDWPAESVSGGPEVHFIHQPSLERRFDEAVRRQPRVEVAMGWEAVCLKQDADGVALTVRQGESGEERVVTGRYVIGVDGANSFVRRSLGIGQEDLGFQADWLVVDMLLGEDVTPQTLGIPECGQYCNPERPTTIVPGGVQDGRICRRWEFMRLPGESRQDLESPEKVWELLGGWIRPDQGELVRHTIYSFRSLVADHWHEGRVLLAGDAAHVMPPFMGQGMCSGLRDAWNLAWKLDLVLRGEAEPTLFDSYTRERKPHVTDIMKASIYLGKIICIPDAAEAEARDRGFLDGTAPPPPPFPSLVDGLLLRAADGGLAGAAGLLSPHGHVAWQGRTGRWDDVIGPGFHVIARSPGAAAALAPRQRALLDGLKGSVVEVGDETAAREDVAIDLDRKFIPFMEERGIAAMIVRPDFYLFAGVASLADLPDAIDALGRQLAEAGVHGAWMPAPAAASQS